ncbi:helix-turn-helix domain-containing protein [Stutzerimonas nitrititolerans]|uniref:helix-turn-helix domain-containing protein n=1 Tax=Stutzerimonas nitrititolerans TaxID=2482751 RepID=UPI0028B18663|nr:helix-turn-helix transcriptional regulator [Stutzerimonas nitrititolerans]
MGLGDRLKEERERLGMSQTEFAFVAGVSKNSQFNYEKGERNPDAAYLEAVASVGVDVLYVLTGIRSGLNESRLAEDESTLLNQYRAMEDSDRATFRRMASALAETAGKYTTRKDSDS